MGTYTFCSLLLEVNKKCTSPFVHKSQIICFRRAVASFIDGSLDSMCFTIILKIDE